MAEQVLAFYGAFNPPTKAHIAIAKYALDCMGYKKVIFIPSKSYYIKNIQNKDRAFNDDLRLMFLRKIAKEYPWMDVCDYDMKQEHQPTTYNSLCHLRDQGYAPVLLVGADVFCDFKESWSNVDKIAKEFGIVVTDRVSDSMYAEVEDLLDFDPFYQELIPYVDFLPVEDKDILCMSSSDTRLIIEDIESLVDNLKDYIPKEIFVDLMKIVLYS